MRELGFAIVGAAALIVLGLWALGRPENSEWADAAKVSKPQHSSAQSAGAVGSLSQEGVSFSPDSVR